MTATTLSIQAADTLKWVADQYYANWHHVWQVYNRHPLARKHRSQEAMRSLLRSWKAQGYIDWARFLADTPRFVYLKPKAIRDIGLDYDPKYIPTGHSKHIRHNNQVNTVRLYLEGHYGLRLGWVSERQLRLQLQREAGDSNPHLADGHFLLEGKTTAAEIERTPKWEKRLADIMRELLFNYDQVWYFCTQSATYGRATTIAQLVDPQQKRLHIQDWTALI